MHAIMTLYINTNLIWVRQKYNIYVSRVFWKITSQTSFLKSLVPVDPEVSEEKIKMLNG